MARWTFLELGVATPQTYVMEINPMQGGSPSVKRSTFTAQRSGPGGTPIVQSGRVDVETLTFTGKIITQAHYVNMDKWARKNTLLQLTDDLNRIYIGIFTEFTPNRVKASQNYWKHEYQATFTITGVNPVTLGTTTTSSQPSWVNDNFSRAAVGSTSTLAGIRTIFGNETVSGLAWQNITLTTSNYLTPLAGTGAKLNAAANNVSALMLAVPQGADMIITLDFSTRWTGNGFTIIARAPSPDILATGLSYTTANKVTVSIGPSGGGSMSTLITGSSGSSASNRDIVIPELLATPVGTLPALYSLQVRMVGTAVQASVYHTASGPPSVPDTQISYIGTPVIAGYAGFLMRNSTDLNDIIKNFSIRGL